MCGICGVIGELPKKEKFTRATAVLSNRGPDSCSCFFDSDANVSLGHTRLRILDLDERSDQPMASRSGRYYIVFNGEIYNFRELRKQYKIQAYTESDTELLLELFELLGVEFVKELNGMFAFVIWDKIENRTFIFRDRVGIKPLYYSLREDSLVFGSEIKAITKFIGGHLPINNSAITDFLQLGYIPKPLTFYENIHKFPQGTYGIFEDGNLELKSYWRVPSYDLNEYKGSFKNAKKELEYLINSSIKYRLIADVSVGTFLSGGIDSSLVTAIASKYVEKKLKTFSIGIKDSKINESQYAKAIAKHLDTDHHEFFFSEEELLDKFETIIDNFDEPFADSSCFPTSFLSEVTRREATVALSGDGGDELFMGYNSYKWAKRLSNPSFFHLRKGLAFGLSRSKVSRHKRVAELLRIPSKKHFYQHIFSQEQYFFSLKELSILRRGVEINGEPIFEAGLKNAEQQQAHFDLLYYLPDDLLTKVDRTSMFHSLEVRVPLLDHRIVDFASKLPSKFKIRRGDTKYILKEILYSHVPQKYFDRPKWGFGIPLAKWLKKDLAYLIDAYLSKELVEEVSMFDVDAVQSYINRFRNGEDYLYNRIWLMILTQRFISNG